MNPTKKLPEFVRVGAVVRATVGDLSVEGEVGRVDSPGNVYTPKGFYIAAVDDDRAEWTLITPAPKTLDEKIADLVRLRLGYAGDGAMERYLEDVDKAGLKLVEK